MYSTPGSRRGKLNLNGVSRDHMLSVTEGWLNNVDIKLIRHPANCNLILHRDNQKKNIKSSISIDELHNRIKSFEELYPNWKSL